MAEHQDVARERSNTRGPAWLRRLLGGPKPAGQGATGKQPVVGTTGAEAILFFEEIAAISTQSGRIVPPVPWGDRTAFGYLWNASQRQAARNQEAERWWSQATDRLVRRFPDADRLVLEWLCDIDGRHGQLVRLRGPRWASGYDRDPSLDWLELWVVRRPTEGGPARIEEGLSLAIPATVQGGPSPQTPQQPPAWRKNRDLELLADFLPLVCTEEEFLDRARRLLERTMSSQPGSPAGGVARDTMLRLFTLPLWRAGRLTPDEQTEIVLSSPSLVGLLDQRAMPSSVRDELRGLVTALLARVVSERRIEPRTQNVLVAYQSYVGFADFAAAVRWLDRAPDVQSSVWASHVLQRLPPPTPADTARLPELAEIRPDAFFVAGVFAPAWTDALDGAGLGEEATNLARLAHWTAQNLGPSPWAQDYAGERLLDWDPAAVIAERAGLHEALAAIGADRLRKLFRHPLLRKHARTAGFCLAAILGENAAEIDEKFLKRDKWAVVALGMLPDEGDVADRYLALRRFGREAQKSGPQRGASEAVAVQFALAHLAATGGYESVDALEWAIEIELAADVDPAARRWSTAGYDLWVEPDEQAAIRVERSGKALKTVPTAVRKTPEYAEAKEARETLLAQTERVRRRLERAMVAAEVLDRAAYEQLLALPAGRLFLARLVLTVRLADGGASHQVLDGRTLDGEAAVPDGVAEFQVAHPLHLAAMGTLEAWQRRLIEAGVVQPINQLFRGVYEPTAEEGTSQVCRRFQGRRVKLGSLRRALLKAGWEAPGWYVGFVRRFVAPAVAELTLTDWVTLGQADEPATLGELGFHGRGWHTRVPCLDPLWFAEAVRDVDLATSAALVDRMASGIVSPEQLAVRAELVRAFVPTATIEGDLAKVPGGAVHLETGAALDSAGRALHMPDHAIPDPFPFPDPDPTTAMIVTRALALVSGGV